MAKFDNISKLIRESREALYPQVSQSKLSEIMGYKNGQFISNIERALCSVPIKEIRHLSEILGIDYERIIAAKVKDYEETLYASANTQVYVSDKKNWPQRDTQLEMSYE